MIGRGGTATSTSTTRTSPAATPSSGSEGAAYWLVDLDSTNGDRGERQARPAREARGRRHVHRRRDRDRLPTGARSDGCLDGGRGGAARPQDRLPRPPLPVHLAHRPHGGRDLRPPQESSCSGPRRRLRRAGRAGAGTVRARTSSSPGARRCRSAASVALDSTSLTIGRGAENDVSLDGDEFASARHARIEPRRDGVWVEDIGSTNGTFVNGERLDGPRRLAPGDVVRVGETDLRFEP